MSPFADSPLSGYKATQRRLLRVTNESLQMINPPNKLLASHPLAKIERIRTSSVLPCFRRPLFLALFSHTRLPCIRSMSPTPPLTMRTALTRIAVIDDPTDTAKWVHIIISYTDGSDDDAITLAEPQLEPFMVRHASSPSPILHRPQWELYNRCPHVPAFAFSSEISAVGKSADFVDLLLLRCRFEVGACILSTSSLSSVSRLRSHPLLLPMLPMRCTHRLQHARCVPSLVTGAHTLASFITSSSSSGLAPSSSPSLFACAAFAAHRPARSGAAEPARHQPHVA